LLSDLDASEAYFAVKGSGACNRKGRKEKSAEIAEKDLTLSGVEGKSLPLFAAWV
jgi:fructose-1,6-bisphosphatase/inositol monophosphatase family enzyme